MKLSKKSRYGITALIDLSINSKSGHVSLSSIAALDGTYRIEDDVTGNEEEERVADRIIQESVIDIINDQLDNVLLNITLADLEKDYLEYNATDDQMYYT